MATAHIERLAAHQYSHISVGEAPRIALEAAKRHIVAAPGKVVVVVWPERKKIGSLYIADSTASDMKPDIGTVVAHGTDELEVGDKVLLKSQAGKCVEGFDTGSWGPYYKDEGEWKCYEVRMYGRVGGGTFRESGDPILQPMKVGWSKAVMAKFEEEQITPLGDNVLVRFDAMQAVTEGGILLAEQAQVPSSLVTVESVGPKAAWARPGMRVWVHEGDVRLAGTDLGIVPEDAVYCRVD